MQRHKFWCDACERSSYVCSLHPLAMELWTFTPLCSVVVEKLLDCKIVALKCIRNVPTMWRSAPCLWEYYRWPQLQMILIPWVYEVKREPVAHLVHGRTLFFMRSFDDKYVTYHDHYSRNRGHQHCVLLAAKINPKGVKCGEIWDCTCRSCTKHGRWRVTEGHRLVRLPRKTTYYTLFYRKYSIATLTNT